MKTPQEMTPEEAAHFDKLLERYGEHIFGTPEAAAAGINGEHLSALRAKEILADASGYRIANAREYLKLSGELAGGAVVPRFRHTFRMHGQQVALTAADEEALQSLRECFGQQLFRGESAEYLGIGADELERLHAAGVLESGQAYRVAPGGVQGAGM